MDFRINKVDIELRNRVKETTKAGVVHKKDKSGLNSINDENKGNKRNFSDNLKDAQNKKKKREYSTDNSISAETFKDDEDLKDKKGLFIDIRK